MKLLKYFIYRMKWHLAYYIKFKYPVHMDLELNTSCNQSCISCWHSSKRHKKETMSMKMAYSRLEWGASMGIKSVKFNLRGEPLLSFYLEGAVACARDLGYVDIMINTNGVLLNEDRIKSLNKSGLTTCIISVDSFDKETYCKLHGCTEVHFNSLQENLLTLYDMRFKLNFKVLLNFHVNVHNRDEIPHAMQNPLTWAFTPIIRYTEKRKGKDITINRKNRKRKKRCPHMMRRITVTANGNTYPCCVCYDEPTDIRLSDFNITLTNNDDTYLCDVKFPILMARDHLIDKYKEGVMSETCLNCTSGDIWR